MKTPRKNCLTSSDKRTKLLAVAERVLMNHGMAGTTIEAIAAEAGMTKGWVFHYFSSKRDIILGVIDRFRVQLEESREQILKKLPDTPARFFKATILAMLKYRKEGVVNLGGIMDVKEFNEHIAAQKIEIFKEIVEHYPYPEKVAKALTIVDGLWMNNMFHRTVYYKGCSREIEDSLLAELDALDHPSTGS